MGSCTLQIVDSTPEWYCIPLRLEDCSRLANRLYALLPWVITWQSELLGWESHAVQMRSNAGAIAALTLFGGDAALRLVPAEPVRPSAAAFIQRTRLTPQALHKVPWGASRHWGVFVAPHCMQAWCMGGAMRSMRAHHENVQHAQQSPT